MALNFLVTGVKMLQKSLDKKKMKEGAKKFVGGDKEDKRARVSKIMDEESSYGEKSKVCLLYTSPSPRDRQKSRMPSSA